MRGLEAAAGALALADRLHHRRRAVHGPIGLSRVDQVDRDDLVRPPALHLEGPEAVERRDVETATSRQRRREGQLRHDLARVEPTGRDDAWGELEGVVPLAVERAFEARDLRLHAATVPAAGPGPHSATRYYPRAQVTI